MMEPRNFHALGVEEIAWPDVPLPRPCPDCGTEVVCRESQWTPCSNAACHATLWAASVGMVMRPKEQA